MDAKELIKEMRRATDLSQSWFADHFDISVRTLQDWELGRSKPPKHVITMMKRILELEGVLSIRFKDDRHKEDYRNLLARMKKEDCCHRAVAYLLALDDVVAEHVDDVFDFVGDAMKTETALHHGWQTGTSFKTTRLAMNLWNGWCCDFDDEGEESSSPAFAVNEIFCCEYAPFYWEAIRLWGPEFCS